MFILQSSAEIATHKHNNNNNNNALMIGEELPQQPTSQETQAIVN